MIKQIADYQLIAELKRGRHATVYRAFEKKRSRFVLLKVLQATDDGTRVRFEKEAAYLTKLKHENLVRVLQYGETQLPSGKSCPFLALEFIEGQTLAELMHGRKLPPDVVIYLAREILSALAVAHRHNIVHRDVKPQNILIDSEGRVKVTDFGLAAAIDSYDEKGEIAGTPQYMSPEQARGASVTPASDLFSVGVLMYEMLTAVSPFDGETMVDRIYRVTHETPAALGNVLGPKLARLATLVHRLLEKKPEQRCPNAEFVLQELAACEAELQQRAEANDLNRFLAEGEQYQPKAIAAASPARPPSRVQPWRYVALASLLLTVLTGAWQLTRLRGGNAPGNSDNVAKQSAVLTSAPSAQTQQDSSTFFEREVQAARPLSTERMRAASALQPVASKPEVPEQKLEPEEALSLLHTENAPPALGYLHLACLPVAYAVWNGDTLGRVDIEPATFALPAGKQILTLHNPRFPTVQRVVELTAADTLHVNVSLWENVALLKVNVQPWAEVFIDSIPYGKTPLREIMLAPGTHTLSFSHPERETFVMQRAFIAGSKDTLNIELRRE